MSDGNLATRVHDDPSAVNADGSHFDVLIIGAGLSGIGAACHLVRKRPQTTFALLEARNAIGGTWDLFRYPGIRSDSDMSTFGYAFRPWDKCAADRRRPLDSALSGRNRESLWRRPPHSFRAHGRAGVLAIRERQLVARRRGSRQREAHAFLQLSHPVHGLLRIRGGLRARLARHGEIRRLRRASSDLARRFEL